MSAVEAPEATYNIPGALEELKTEVRNVRQKLDESDAVSMSKCPRDKYTIILQDMGLDVELVPVPDDIQGDGVAAFEWDLSLTEQKQLSQCLLYLQTNICIPEDCKWEIVDNDKGFLNVPNECSGSRFNLNGTSDIAIIDSKLDEEMLPQAGIVTLFELKKQVSREHVLQAHLELIAASRLSQLQPVVVLTDLKNTWKMYWIQDAKICIMGLTRSQAFQVMSLSLQQVYKRLPPETSFKLPDKLVNRTKLERGSYGRQAVDCDEEDYQDMLLSPAERYQKHRQSIMAAASRVLPWCVYIA